MTNPEDTGVQLRNLKRRLQKLKEREALLGYSAPPELLLEIEDIEAKIETFGNIPAKAEARASNVPSGGIVIQGDNNVIATGGGIAVGGNVSGGIHLDGKK